MAKIEVLVDCVIPCSWQDSWQQRKRSGVAERGGRGQQHYQIRSCLERRVALVFVHLSFPVYCTLRYLGAVLYL